MCTRTHARTHTHTHTHTYNQTGRGERRGHGGETEKQEREGTQNDRGEAQANGGDHEYDAPQMQQQDRSKAQYDAVQMLEVDEEGRDAEDDMQEMLGSSHRREEGTKAQLHAPHIATAHHTSISVELVSKGITKQACRDVHQQSRHGQPSLLFHHTPSKMTVAPPSPIDLYIHTQTHIYIYIHIHTYIYIYIYTYM